VARLFGTDGVRGLANGDLTAELALDLSVSAAHILAEAGTFEGHRPVAVVGRDTRISGQFLEAAVVAGLASAGVDVFLLGELPTPGVAWLTGELGADLGVMLSASHNAMPDNGIKFFARGGNKLDDAVEDTIEDRLTEVWARPTGAGVGRVSVDESLVETYVAHVVNSLERPVSLDGIKVVVDCANGAGFQAAPAAFEAQGADVHRIHAQPDGININDNCGSTHMETLQRAVVSRGADLGLAHDGDADRCLAVDAEGRLVDGDAIMVILALAMQEAGELASNTLVATVMSNLGLKLAMADAGIRLLETKVGDRYVLEELDGQELSLGGEQSGHIIFRDHATTGDGILTGLQLAAEMARTGKTLTELVTVMTVYPQVLVNVPGVDQHGLEGDTAIADAVRAAEAQLGDTGRVLLRPSGTEPLVRVTVEGEDADEVKRLADLLADAVKSAA